MEYFVSFIINNILVLKHNKIEKCHLFQAFNSFQIYATLILIWCKERLGNLGMLFQNNFLQMFKTENWQILVEKTRYYFYLFRVDTASRMKAMMMRRETRRDKSERNQEENIRSDHARSVGGSSKYCFLNIKGAR